MSSIKSMTEKNKSMTYFYEKQTRLGNNINRILKSSTNEGHVNVVTSRPLILTMCAYEGCVIFHSFDVTWCPQAVFD